MNEYQSESVPQCTEGEKRMRAGRGRSKQEGGELVELTIRSQRNSDSHLVRAHILDPAADPT